MIKKFRLDHQVGYLNDDNTPFIESDYIDSYYYVKDSNSIKFIINLNINNPYNSISFNVIKDPYYVLSQFINDNWIIIDKYKKKLKNES